MSTELSPSPATAAPATPGARVRAEDRARRRTTAAVWVTRLALLVLLIGGWALVSRDAVWINLIGSPGLVADQLVVWVPTPTSGWTSA